jgi:hypothetical protein
MARAGRRYFEGRDVACERRRGSWAAAFGVPLVLASIAAGQQPARESNAFLNEQRALEERARRALDREIPTADRFSLDIGGWLDNYIFLFDDGVKSSRTLRQYDLRVFASLSADHGVHEAYARMRTS